MTCIAKSYQLIDGYEKVTGRLKFTADIDIPNLAHVKMVFSPHAHALITGIDVSEAESIPGVLGVFHNENTPSNYYNSTIWEAGQRAPEDEQMFPQTVRHIGDRVAAVVAETIEIAAHAAKLIKVTYEPLEARLSALDGAGSIGIHEPGKPNFTSPAEDVVFDYGDPEAAFDTAYLIVEDIIETPKTHHLAIETHACTAIPDGAGRVNIHSPCQSVFAVQAVTAQALGIESDNIRATKAAIGGSFGGKAEPILEPLCAHFALVLRRSVMIAYDRHETCTATRSRSKAIGRIRTAVSREGKILARETDVVIDIGAYCTGGHFLPVSMSQRMRRLYDIPHQKYRGRSIYTNTMPTGAYRGYGSPQIHAISEINLDSVANKLGMDPVAFRLKNLLEPFAKDPIMGVCIGNSGMRECLEQGSQKFKWREKRKHERQSGRFRKGLGVACATHINGCFPGAEEGSTATLSLCETGQIAITCAVHDLGCGSTTVLAQIAASVLNVHPSDILFNPVDTATTAFDLGTRASRVTFITGEAIRRTAEVMKECILSQASRALNAPPGEIALVDGRVECLADRFRSLSLAQLYAAASTADEKVEATEVYVAGANPGSYAAHFVEVEVDTFTGAVKILSYLAAHDLGRAVNPQLVAGQVYGGVQMGLGMGLYEDIDIDPETGRIRADRLSKYHVANAPEMPDVDILLVEKHEASGPFGAKAVGEITTIPVAPAVVNAVNHALGAKFNKLPLTRERVLMNYAASTQGL